MIDMSTKYLGLSLPHPLIAGASPLVDDLDAVKELEQAGAAAIVMHSLFEEQILREEAAAQRDQDASDSLSPEATSFFPQAHEFCLGPEQYLQQITQIKQAVKVPVIASLNGISSRGWIRYAKLIEEAGADALELNVYYVATDLNETGAQVEQRTLEIIANVHQSLRIPLAVKLSPFYSSLANFARQVDILGVAGLVLANRFYQPDIDVEELVVVPTLTLSTSAELLLRLRWLAVLWGRVNASLAVTGGVHSPLDVVKALMAGAHAVQVVSALLRHGPRYMAQLRLGLEQWLQEHEYQSVQQMQGSMSLQRCPNPGAFERANYMKVLQSWG